jgi:hypothetical protein
LLSLCHLGLQIRFLYLRKQLQHSWNHIIFAAMYGHFNLFLLGYIYQQSIWHVRPITQSLVTTLLCWVICPLNFKCIMLFIYGLVGILWPATLFVCGVNFKRAKVFLNFCGYTTTRNVQSVTYRSLTVKLLLPTNRVINISLVQ